MDTNALKTFATRTRKDLLSQVARRLDAVLPADSDARREAPAAMAELDREIARTGRAAVIDRVAYTWFNRFTALRYMDARGYLVPRVVSPADGETRSEILSQAAQGVLPDHLRKEVAAQVRDLLEGRSPSREPQVEAYRRLVVASCNALHGLMPFLFERIADYTELLMPNELLAETGWVAELRAVMTPDACEDVEIIGWLYQFYISEKKQDVFDALKKNVKITAANIPAATQLFTPHWIVRYLVENSLGRLWLLNHPESGLAAKMDYYIAPEEPETDFLRIDSPEEIRVCDPACGSGHMLTYAFDLLYDIYAELGYAPRDIPGLILTHNLTGLEIDDRAGGLAAFALMMKAANKLGRRGFLRMEARPDVIVLEEVTLRLSDFNNLLPPLGYDLNVDRLAGGLKTVPLALSGVWSQVSAYLKRAEGPGFEDAFEAAETVFASGLSDEIGLFDEAANNPFLVNQIKELRSTLLAIADKDSKQRDRTALEREFGKRTRSPLIAVRVTRIGSDYRSHKNDTTYRMELDALVDRVEEAVRHPEALSRLKEVEDRLNAAVGFHAPLWATVLQFGHAKNFGSLIVPKLRDPAEALRVVAAWDFAGDLLLKDVQARVVAVLRMAEALSPKYHVVVANPPYAGAKGLNAALQSYTKDYYPDSKSDLFAAFMERGLTLTLPKAFSAMVTMESWMFLTSYEKLRGKLLDTSTIQSMVHMPYLGKGGTSMGISFGTAAFVFEKGRKVGLQGSYICVRYYETDENGIPLEFPVMNERYSKVSVDEFDKIPSRPIAYWVSDKVRNAFSENKLVGDVCDVCAGHQTGDNDRFLRQWSELSRRKISRSATNRNEAKESGAKWFPHNKGGEFRRWFGNSDLVMNWENDGAEVRAHPSAALRNPTKMFNEGVSWSHTTSGSFGARFSPAGTTFNVEGPTLFNERPYFFLGLLCSSAALQLIQTMSQTLHFLVGTVSKVPTPEVDDFSGQVTPLVEQIVEISKSDWDAYETSWDFTTLPLLHPDHRAETLEHTYTALRTHWQGMTDDVQRLEEENNRIFIDAYGLADELTPEVPLKEITLTCNPAYSIKGDISDETREARLRERTVKEFISSAIGCMFGRYSLDAPGLILANQGDTLQDYLARIPEPTFEPDADNIIPVLGDDRFEDDAYVRFRTFLSLTFGPDRLDENLAFLREALGRDVRDYLAKRFFEDHSDRYKKRPIYWLISSPKGAFQALIYMHRYNPDTLNTVLTRYVRPLRDRIEAAVRGAEGDMITASASAAQRNKAQKEIDRLNKQITELTDWERDHLYPMALQRIQIDLDDGVKRNYPLFEGVMRTVKGMTADE